MSPPDFLTYNSVGSKIGESTGSYPLLYSNSEILDVAIFFIRKSFGLVSDMPDKIGVLSIGLVFCVFIRIQFYNNEIGFRIINKRFFPQIKDTCFVLIRLQLIIYNCFDVIYRMDNNCLGVK